jgi:tripartite-type tricarboxylate transporter receptor subunit TctC
MTGTAGRLRWQVLWATTAPPTLFLAHRQSVYLLPTAIICTKEGIVSISESRKSRAGTRPVASKIRRIQHRDLNAGMLHRSTVNATEFARRRFLHLAAGAAGLPAVSRDAWAQAYPSRPITMIVPYPGGAPMDVIGRVVAEQMRKSLGQAIIIENVSGADGSIGTGRAARARPDGYSISIGSMATHVMNAGFYSLQYDTLVDFLPVTPLIRLPFILFARKYDTLVDFLPVTPLIRLPFILFARKTMPPKDLNELIAWMSANPDASIAITNVGIRLLSAFFQKETGTQFTLVPYRGLPAAVQDLAAGQVDFLFGTPDQLPLMRAGSIKAYAVTTDTRLAIAPDVPTFIEMGLPTLSYTDWIGLFAPKGTPKDMVAKLHTATVEALADPAVRTRLVELGFEVFPRDQQNPEAFAARIRTDADKWWPIIRASGIRAQ